MALYATMMAGGGDADGARHALSGRQGADRPLGKFVGQEASSCTAASA